MALKKFKPVTPSLRFKQLNSREELTADKPYKPLTEGLRKKAGRNNQGRITVRRRGGGHKRLYRLVDFKRAVVGVNAVVETIEYDPNRTANIALLHYVDGAKAYILAPEGLHVGDMVVSGTKDVDIKPGNCTVLSEIPVGTLLHNVEFQPGKGAAMARSAGTSVQLMGKDNGYAALRMPSGELRRVLLTCRATIGVVGNAEHGNIVIGKAGRHRHMNVRPTVRGTVMNPVDHPHGGGEGKNHTSGRPSVTPWGKPTKGFKTRDPKKASNRLIIRRRNKK